MQQIANINTLEKININFEFTNENLIAYGYKPNDWFIVPEELRGNKIIKWNADENQWELDEDKTQAAEKKIIIQKYAEQLNNFDNKKTWLVVTGKMTQQDFVTQRNAVVNNMIKDLSEV